MGSIRAIVIGIGSVGSGIHRVMLDKGVDIVGAIDADPAKAGQDLGQVLGLDRDLGVIVQSDEGKVLGHVPADIAVVSVATFEPTYPVYLACIDASLDVISTDDQATHPWALYPDQSIEIDRRARAQGVTVTASGNQDALGVHLPLLISGCCSEVRTITALVKTNLNNAGAQTCRDFHAGATLEAFHANVGGKQEFRPFRHYAESIAAGLGLTVTGVSLTDEPLTDETPVHCIPLATSIEPGLVTGKNTITEVTTEEGITIRAEYAVKVFAEEEQPKRVWQLSGTPDMNVDYTAPGVPPISRATQLVNRIPDVLNMSPGLVTIDAYPPLKYRHKPLHNYVRTGKKSKEIK